MRLIRLLAYVALGYFVYEFYQGLSPSSGGGSSMGGARRAGSRPLARALDQNSGRMNLTGTGRGATVSVEGGGGAMSNRTVGRGVVER